MRSVSVAFVAATVLGSSMLAAQAASAAPSENMDKLTSACSAYKAGGSSRALYEAFGRAPGHSKGKTVANGEVILVDSTTNNDGVVRTVTTYEKAKDNGEDLIVVDIKTPEGTDYVRYPATLEDASVSYDPEDFWSIGDNRAPLSYKGHFPGVGRAVSGGFRWSVNHVSAASIHKDTVTLTDGCTRLSESTVLVDKRKGKVTNSVKSWVSATAVDVPTVFITPSADKILPSSR